MTAGGVMKRLDLAINDRAGILDIPKLKEKYKAGECVSYFRMQKDYSGTEKCGSDIPKNTGETLYLGSTSSELYMCAYQKNYEQYVKNGTEIENTEIKNRFEIRMKNERAYYAVVDLLRLMPVPFLWLVRPVFVANATPFVKCKALALWLSVSALCFPLQTMPNHHLLSIDFLACRPLCQQSGHND